MRGPAFGMLVGFAIMGCKQEAPPISTPYRSQPCGPQTCTLHEICVQRPVTQWLGDTPSRDGTCGSGHILHHCDDGETLCCAEGMTAFDLNSFTCDPLSRACENDLTCRCLTDICGSHRLCQSVDARTVLCTGPD